MGVSLRPLAGKDFLRLNFEKLCRVLKCSGQGAAKGGGVTRRTLAEQGAAAGLPLRGCLLCPASALPQPAPGKALEEKPVSWAGA